MHKPSYRDFSCIINMLESIQKIQDYSCRFNNADELLFSFQPYTIYDYEIWMAIKQEPDNDD